MVIVTDQQHLIATKNIERISWHSDPSYQQSNAPSTETTKTSSPTLSEEPPVVKSLPAQLRTPAEVVLETLNPACGPLSKRYVTCGVGTAAFKAVDALLKLDRSAAGDILAITDKTHYPYICTILSKGLWTEPDGDVEYAYRNKPPGSGARVVILKPRASHNWIKTPKLYSFMMVPPFLTVSG